MEELGRDKHNNVQSSSIKTEKLDATYDYSNDALIIGQQLSAARKKKNKSVDEVSRQLKVAKTKILLIEEGNLYQLPDQVFTIGLLRSYAKLLNIDICFLIEKIKSSGSWQAFNVSNQTIDKQSNRRAYVHLTWGTRRVRYDKFWLIFIVFLVVLGVAAVVWKLNASGKNWLPRWYKNNIDSISTDQFAHTSSDNNPILDNDISSLPKNNESELSNSETNNQINSMANSSIQENELITPSNEPVKIASETTVATDNSNNLVNSNEVAAQNNLSHSNELKFKTSEDTWISVTTLENKILFSGIISANSEKIIFIQKPIKLTIGNKSGISQLTDNNNLIDIQAYAKNSSQVVHLILN